MKCDLNTEVSILLTEPERTILFITIGQAFVLKLRGLGLIDR